MATGESTTSLGRTQARPATAPAAAAQRRPERVDPRRHPEERRQGVPPARLSRRDRRADRRRAAHEEGQSLLLLQEQGRDPLRLPPVLARSADRAARGDRAQRRCRRRQAAAADRRVRAHDPRRAARHGAVPGSRSAVAGAPEGGDRAARHVRPRRAAGDRGRDGHGRVRARRPQAARVRAVRRRQLDSAVVQPGRPRELAGDRRSVRRFSDRWSARSAPHPGGSPTRLAAASLAETRGDAGRAEAESPALRQIEQRPTPRT